MNPDRAYPVTIIQDRYCGLYSGGDWFAIAEADTPFGPVDLDPSRAAYCLEDGPNSENDAEAKTFWRHRPTWIAVGKTPDQAVEALLADA